MNTKWIIYGIAGLTGLGLVAGGAAATAANMDLRTTDGSVVPGGTLTDRGVTNAKSVIDGDKVQLRETNSSVTVVSAPSVVTAPSAPTAASAASVASAPSAPAPAPQASAPSAASTPSPASAPSAASVASAASD